MTRLCHYAIYNKEFNQLVCGQDVSDDDDVILPHAYRVIEISDRHNILICSVKVKFKMLLWRNTHVMEKQFEKTLPDRLHFLYLLFNCCFKIR